MLWSAFDGSCTRDRPVRVPGVYLLTFYIKKVHLFRVVLASHGPKGRSGGAGEPPPGLLSCVGTSMEGKEG